MIYFYYDGSGNEYKIENQTIYYQPITPKESSSGYYSGGKPFQKKLSNQEYNEIKELLEKSFQKLEEQADARAMLTGLVIIQNANEKKSCILMPNSEIKKNIEVFLQQYKEK